MTFGVIENTRAKGRPVNLFLIRYGSSSASYYAYTDSTSPITTGGVTYQPVPIKRGAIVVKGNMDKAALEVRMHMALDTVNLFRDYPPSSVVTLVIKQGHLSDSSHQYLTIWAGRIIAAKREAPELVMTCEPVRTTLKRLGLRRHYQYSCAHVLYGERCGASKSAATESKTVTAVGSRTVAFSASWTLEEQRKRLGGMIEWDNANGDPEVRTIIRVAAASGTVTLTLSGAPRDISSGTVISVVKGCARDMDGCSSHSNILNFGGCPFIPTKNPVGKTSIYY